MVFMVYEEVFKTFYAESLGLMLFDGLPDWVGF